MKLLIALAASLPLCATTTIQQIEPTPTQAIVRVLTNQAGYCTYRVSEAAGFTPLDHDVDTTLYAGSNSDARTGSAVDGKRHTFVIGARTSGAALDGKMYSRALQASTAHYLGVTCGTDAEVTAQFSTQNPPFGNSYPESAPFNAAAFGNYAWPSIDFTDQSKTYVDPMTGVALKRITGPGLYAKDYQNTAFGAAFDLNSAWTSPSNITTWPGSGSTLASYSGTASDPIFVAADLTVIADYGYGDLAISGWTPQNTVDDILVRTYGFGNNATAANRTVLACLSMNSGQTCSTPEISVILPATSAATGPTAPASGFPHPAWTGWATTPPFSGRDFGNVITTVTTASHTITNTGAASNQMFLRDWGVGCKLLVNGTETYTISALVNSTTITTAETMTTHASPVAFKSLCAGVRIRKQTATGTISLSVGYDLAVSAESTMPITGIRNMCSSQTVSVTVDAAGNPAAARTARLCAAPTSGAGHVLFAFFADNGESRLISNFKSIAGYQYSSPDWTLTQYNNPSASLWTEGDIWSPTIATRAYTQITISGHPCLVQVDYTGNFSAYNPAPATGGYLPLGGSWANDGLTYTVVGGFPSANRGVDQQTAALGNAYFNSAIWGNWTFTGLISGGIATWQAQANANGHGNENPTFFVYQNVATGNVTKVVDTIGTYPLRFWCNHGSQIVAGTLSFTANTCGNPQSSAALDSQRYLGGPFITTATQIQKSGTWTSDTSLTSTYADVCPNTIAAQWQALGATGTNCILMRAQQPCSSYADNADGESTSFPCPWDGSNTKSMLAPLAPGDRFWLERNGTDPNSGSAETMRVVTTPVDQGGGITQFWALRKSENYGNLGGSYGGTGYSHADGWSAMMLPPEARSNISVTTDSSGNVYAETYLASATHGAIGAGLSAGNATSVMEGYDPVAGAGLPNSWGIRWSRSYPGQIGSLPDYSIGVNGRFAGTDNGSGAMETYASMQQNQAPANEKRWFLDFHHMNPSGGVGQEVKAAIGPTSTTLVSGTTGTYLFTSYPGSASLDVKHSNPFAYAGSRLLKDISGPASLINDSTPDSYCVVYVAGGCQPGSSVGQVYTSVAKADAPSGNCIAGWYAQTIPCVLTPHPTAGWAMQYDASRPASDENYWRNITQGFSGVGRQYQFGNITPEPDGQWAFMQCYWCGGVRNDIFAVKMPPMPSYESGNRADFVSIPVTLGSGPGVSARAKFGYAENGAVGNFYCSTRQESCVTDSSVSPYAYLQSDALTPTACPSGCTLQIPAISGRILYYKIERLDASGNIVWAGQTIPIYVNSQVSGPNPASSVTFTMGSGQLSSLVYNGTSMYYSGHSTPVVTKVSLTDSGGTVTSGSLTATSTITTANTITKIYPWGSVSTTYEAIGNKLKTTSAVTSSTATQTITSLELIPTGVQFPATPISPPGTPLDTNIDGPSSNYFNWGTGSADVVDEDVTTPLINGFSANDSPIGQHWNILLHTDNQKSFGNYPPANRPIPPLGSDVFVESIRFGGASSTEIQLAGDVFNTHAGTYPLIVNPLPFAPVAAIHISSKSRPNYALNPRGWFNNSPSEDVTTTPGITAFQADLLTFADNAVTEIQRVGGSGAILWDIEGQLTDNTYVGDPTQAEAEAPELVGVLDTFVGKFTTAGLKVGFTIRPQLYSHYAGTVAVSGTSVTWVSGSKFGNFNASCTPGTCDVGNDFMLTATGLHYQIASVNSATSLTLTTSAGTPGTVAYYYGQHLLSSQVQTDLAAKIQYCITRWGASLFYVDSNTIESTGAIYAASIYQGLQAQFPGVYIFPEQKSPRHYAYTIPYEDPSISPISVPVSVSEVYTHATQLITVSDTVSAQTTNLHNAICAGSMLLWDGWYTHTAGNNLITIYAMPCP